MKQYEIEEWASRVLRTNILDTNEISKAVAEKYTAFEQIRFINSLKKVISIPTYHLKNKPRMFIFGAGGTTSWFLPKVLKIFNDLFSKHPELKYPFEIILVDGDTVEFKNIIRQNFIQLDVGQNKAAILSERYSELYPNIKVSFVNRYGYYTNNLLDCEKSAKELNHFINLKYLNINKIDMLVNLVDNEGFKKQLDAFIKDFNHIGLYLSSGLNLFNGQVYYTTGNVALSNSYTIDHPDLFNDFEEVSVTNCADADANGTADNPDQMFNGNDLAASFLANLLQSVLSDIVPYQRINFISGSNISCNKEGRYYGLIFKYLSLILNRPAILTTEYRNAIRYVDQYGLDQTTAVSKNHYTNYSLIQELKGFKDFLESLESLKTQESVRSTAPIPEEV